LSREINLVLEGRQVRTQFDKHALVPEGSTPEALAAFLKQELQTWGRAIRDAGITVE
jgi:tripartite-type tricarboxylate transporter receptor subunit TctC